MNDNKRNKNKTHLGSPLAELECAYFADAGVSARDDDRLPLQPRRAAYTGSLHNNRVNLIFYNFIWYLPKYTIYKYAFEI